MGELNEQSVYIQCNVAVFHSVFVFFFNSVRLISRKGQNLSTVLPPPPISPLNMVKDVAYNREFNMMYLLIDEQEIWVYYTRYSFSNGSKGVVGWAFIILTFIPKQALRAHQFFLLFSFLVIVFCTTLGLFTYM